MTCLCRDRKPLSLILSLLPCLPPTVPPVITAAHPEQVAVLGQPVTLRCQVEGQPTPEITWLRERRPVAEGGRLRMFANGTLWLAAVQRADGGLYTCAASNLAGRGSADVRLIVHGELHW